MMFCRLRLGNFSLPAWLPCVTALGALFSAFLFAHAQPASQPGAAENRSSTSSSSLESPADVEEFSIAAAPSEPELPESPESAAAGGGRERPNVAASAEWNEIPFSRIGIGADVSPLGIGIKSAIVLDRYFDARLMGNFFSYTSGRVEVEGFNVNANLHLASMATSLDFYPFNSIWRLSPGLMFFNGNRISGTGNLAPGASVDMDNLTFYSATPNPLTGATPLTGSGVLGLHNRPVAATLAGGFGRFIPRSERHWSFPSEFGVIFTGSPTVNVNLSGWACLDAAQTQCSNLSNAANPITIQFNNALQSTLTKWRHDLSRVDVYPIFSYSVVYSFDIR